MLDVGIGWYSRGETFSVTPPLSWHCVSLYLRLSVTRFADPSMWVVHVGLTEQPIHGAQSLAVEQIIYHTRYRPKGLDYDIALMKLAVSLAFTGTGVPFLAEHSVTGSEVPLSKTQNLTLSIRYTFILCSPRSIQPHVNLRREITKTS